MNHPGLPRTIPAGARMGLYLRSTIFLFGLFLFLFGAGFLALANNLADFGSTRHFKADDPLVAGVLLSKKPTGVQRDDDEGVRYAVYEYRYTYRVGSDQYQGRAFAPPSDLNQGSRVPVAYVADQPALSRIDGMSGAPAVLPGIGLALVATAIACVGIALLHFGIKTARKHSHLARNGVLTTGVVTGKVATNTTVNGMVVYEVHFEFQHEDGRTCTSHVLAHDMAALKGTEREQILYDIAAPEKAVLVDALPLTLRALLRT